MVDKSIVLRKIAGLDTYHHQLKTFSDITIDDYKGNWKTQRIVERTLQIMIEICVDIATHIISDGGMRVPTSYSDTFKVLFEHNIINSELFTIMEKMAKFRNVVVHQYEEVNAEIVMLILNKHLDDFERFKDAVLEYIKSH